MKAEVTTPAVERPYRSHEEPTVESFARDPAYASENLNAVLKDGDEVELRVTLQRMARAADRQPPPQ